MGLVRNEAFYAVAAQVLPTLLIALAVEANLLLERRRKALEQAHQQMIEVFETLARQAEAVAPGRPDVAENHLRLHEETINEYRWWFRHHQVGMGGQRRWAIRAGVAFMLGETASVVALMAGPGRLWVVAAPLTALALLFLSLLVVILPVLRFPTHLDLQESDPRAILESLRAARLDATDRMLREQRAEPARRMTTFDTSPEGNKRRKGGRYRTRGRS